MAERLDRTQDSSQWNVGKCVTTTFPGKMHKGLICSLCRLPWYKYSYHSQVQAALDVDQRAQFLKWQHLVRASSGSPLVETQVLPLTSCVNLGKLLNLSNPWCLACQMGIMASISEGC